jgi:hypothetical protein
MDWMVAPSFPAFAAALPDSTGMLTFSKNRMLHILSSGVTASYLTKNVLVYRGRGPIEAIVCKNIAGQIQ